MDIHGSAIDHWSEGIPVMSILHRTYRVTHLRVIYLLSTRQGVREKVTEKVSETPKMFWRENRKCFWNTENCFGVNHQAKKVSARVRKFLEGAGNVLGPSGIFLERTHAKKHSVPGWGTRSHGFVERLFYRWGPHYGVAHIWWKFVGGPPHGGGKHPQMVEHVWRRWGPHWGSPKLGRPRWWGPPMGLPPTFGGLMLWRGGPLGLSSTSHPSPLAHTIKGGGEELSNSLKFLTTGHAMICHSFSSLHEIVS